MRRHHLDTVIAPTPVYVHAEVVSPAEARSPVSGARAALIQWYAFGRGAADRFDEHLASGILGESLLLVADGRSVRVPTRYLQIYFAAANADATLLLDPLPAGLDELARSHRAVERLRRGELFYREHLLQPGAPVRLRAVVTPRRRQGAYRTSADDELVVVDEQEHPTLAIDVPEFA